VVLGGFLLLVVVAGIGFTKFLALPCADWSLRSAAAEYRAAGQPIYPSDLDPPPVPEPQNAAFVLRQAAAACDVLSWDEKTLIGDLFCHPEVFDLRRADFIRISQETTAARVMVRMSRSMPGTDWGIRFRTPLTRVMLPDLNPQRCLAKALSVHASYCRQSGRDVEALETIRDILFLAGQLDKQPILVSHTLACAIQEVAVSSLEDLCAGLRVSGVSGTTRPVGEPATRAQVQEIISMLLDGSGLREGLTRALYVERAMQLDIALLIADGREHLVSADEGAPSSTECPSRMAGSLGRAKVLLDMRRLLKWTTTRIEAAALLTWPAFSAQAVPAPQPFSEPMVREGDLSSMFLSIMDHVARFHYRTISLRRMAAVALTMRLYEIDCGRRPDRLDDLVPKYLQRVPDDPFGSNGRKIAYNPKGTRSVLYSVNLDGVDEGGAFRLVTNGDIDSETKDQPFFLNGDRPRLRSANFERQPTTATSRPGA